MYNLWLQMQILTKQERHKYKSPDMGVGICESVEQNSRGKADTLFVVKCFLMILLVCWCI